MLGRTDRLRVLCTILGLDMEQFLNGLATGKAVEPGAIRDAVRDWWFHRHQPTKHVATIIEYLQSVADDKGFKPKIAELWHGEFTASEFADQCGLSLEQLAAVVSDVTRRSCFELVDRFPFLRLMRAEAVTRSKHIQEAMRSMAGTYFVYRVHSSERLLCREIVSIEPPSSGLSWNAHYTQYAEHHRQRPIELSLLVGDAWLHAIGAYRDMQDDGTAQISMVHATVNTRPYKEKLFAGILLDMADNKTTVSAQRILLLRVSNDPAPGGMHVQAFNRTRSVRMLRYRKFLKDEEIEDVYHLTADPNRIARMLEAILTDDDFKP